MKKNGKNDKKLRNCLMLIIFATRVLPPHDGAALLVFRRRILFVERNRIDGDKLGQPDRVELLVLGWSRFGHEPNRDGLSLGALDIDGGRPLGLKNNMITHTHTHTHTHTKEREAIQFRKNKNT